MARLREALERDPPSGERMTSPGDSDEVVIPQHLGVEGVRPLARARGLDQEIELTFFERQRGLAG